MSNKVPVKSISRLDYSDAQGEDLLWISRDGGERYHSLRTTVDSVVKYAKNEISSDLKDEWNVPEGADIGQLADDVAALSSENVQLGGQKSFAVLPKYTPDEGQEKDYDEVDDYEFVTKKLARQACNDSGVLVGGDSHIVVDPDNATPTTSEDVPLVWRIPHGKTDSLQYQPIGGDAATPQAYATGNLVVYGWLADSGIVRPQEAWVALYGLVNVPSSSGTVQKWVILQVQPWAKTDNSNKLQYVGFNVPVKQGLKLRIKTGFPVNQSATAINEYNTLTFANVQHNTFCGYIIEG